MATLEPKSDNPQDLSCFCPMYPCYRHQEPLWGMANTMIRLDKALANPEWWLKFLEASVSNIQLRILTTLPSLLILKGTILMALLTIELDHFDSLLVGWNTRIVNLLLIRVGMTMIVSGVTFKNTLLTFKNGIKMFLATFLRIRKILKLGLRGFKLPRKGNFLIIWISLSVSLKKI